jgi:hypothetical protein
MRRSGVAIAILLFMVLVCCGSARLFAQTSQPPSLEEQLKTQYTLVKVATDGRVLEPGTVLAIQKAGILAVVPSSLIMCGNKYQDSNLKPAGGFCKAAVANTSRELTVGEKVYAWKLKVEIPKEKLTLQVIECDSCNGVSQPSLYKAQVEFQFAKGYLEKASVPEVEDIIGQVLTVDEGGDQQMQRAQDQQPAQEQPNEPPQAPPCAVDVGQSPDQVVHCLGQPEKIITVGPKQIYVYKDLKVTFLNGKVSDVQ